MSLTTSEMTPADIAAVTRCNDNSNDGGFGGSWSSWIILFLIFGLFGFGGFGGFGFGGGFGGYGGSGGANFQGIATRADINEGFALNNLTNGIRGIQQGICDSTYALNNSINGLGTTVMQGFHGVDNAVCNLGYQVQQGFNQSNMGFMQGLNTLQSQIADCCCGTQRAIDGINYNLSNSVAALQNALCSSTRDIIEAQNNGTRAILDAYTAQRIEAKDQRIAEQAQTINQLQLSAALAAQNSALTATMDANTATIIRRTGNDCPMPAYVVQPPQPVSFATNCCGQVGFSGGNGCGNSCC